MRSLLISIALVLISGLAVGQVSPFMGIGNAQFLDQNGKPLTAGVLYSFQAGTSTQQATFTDSTGLILNPNPIPFSSGARVNIWLTTANTYKFVLCLQNDGPSCAPADVLFSVDQVPGGVTGGGGGGGGAPFISNSASPATTGILRLASGDSICFRNAANSGNLCIAKDSSDVLNWTGGLFKLPEGTCSTTGANFDYLCGGSSNHRMMMSNNAGSYAQVVGSGVDINTSDQVTQFHFGATGQPLSGTAPTTNQFLQWNGTNIVGGNAEISWSGYVNTLASGNTVTVAQSVLVKAHTLVRLGVAMLQSPVGCGNGSVAVIDSTSSSTLTTLTLTAGSLTDDSGALSVAMTAGHTFQLSMTQATGCGTFPNSLNITAVYQ